MKKLLVILVAFYCTGALAQCTASLSFSASGIPVFCQGNNLLINANPTNAGTGAQFVWKLNGNPTAQNTATYGSNTLVQGDVLECTLTVTDGCAAGQTITNSYTVNFKQGYATSVSVNPQGLITPGSNVTVTGSISNPFARGITYRFYVNDLLQHTVQGNSSAAYSYPPQHEDKVFVTTMAGATSNPCASVFSSDTVLILLNQVLPVQFSEFSIKKAGNNIHLSWTTNAELNTDFFQAEESLNGTHFLVTGKIQAADNTRAPHKYIYDYPLPASTAAALYFRITAVDKDGRLTHSETRILRQKPEISIFPNPATDQVYIRGEGIRLINLYDVSGRLLQTWRGLTGNNWLPLKQFRPGNYQIQVLDATGQSFTKRIILY